MRDLKDQQIGETAEMVPANKNSSTKREHMIPATETHMIHAEIEAKAFDPLSGEKLSTPIIQSFYPKDFDLMEQEQAFTGKSVIVLHDPRSKNIAKSDKEDAAVASGVRGEQMDKPLADMSTAELRLKYADLYKEEAPKGASDQSMRDAIEDKFIEIRGLENIGKLNKDAAEAGKGDLKDGVNEGAPGAKKEARDAKKKEDAEKDGGTK